MELNIFPLPVLLLPGGVTRLRIFEPKYMDLVTQSYQDDGFALLTWDNKTQGTPSRDIKAGDLIASWVEIINFDILENGLLQIDIMSRGLLKIKDLDKCANGLLRAECDQLTHWSTIPAIVARNNVMISSTYDSNLATFLDDIFLENPELAALYTTKFNQDITWICARLLEICPFPITTKRQFLYCNSFDLCVEFLHTAIKGE